MRKLLIAAGLLLLLTGGFAYAVATTGTVSACATSPVQTISANGVKVGTISPKTACTTVTYTQSTVTEPGQTVTAPGQTTTVTSTETTTVTQTVTAPATTTAPTTTTTPTTTATSPPAGNWAGTFDCYGSGPNCPTPSPPSCTSTISSGLQTAITNAAGGDVICLNTGNYTMTLTNLSKSSTVTIRPASGAAADITDFHLENVNHLTFTGAVGGATLKIGDPTDVRATAANAPAPGYAGDEQIDRSANPGSCSHDLDLDHITFVAEFDVTPLCTNMNILIDHNRFDNIAAENLCEGRLCFQAVDNGPSAPVGITVSNNHFAGGCADGIQLLGGSYAVQIGPGNEFTDLTQHRGGLDCALNQSTPHVDPIQSYGGRHDVIISNWWHDNPDGNAILANGGDCNATIKNNVFYESGTGYSIFIGAGCNHLFQHNVFVRSKGIAGIDFDSYNGTNPAGNVVRDNTFDNENVANVCGCAWGTADHNLNSGVAGTGNINGTPTYVSSPASGYYHYELASNSPGYQAASDGNSMGICAVCG